MGFLPKVSIVIPVYNGTDFLSQAIDSALAQTYSNTEILVVNDGSDDDGATEQIALSYGDKIRYFAKENGGVASALNVAIDNMTGDYFSWLSHDDIYYHDKIDSQIKVLLGMSQQRTILYGDYAVFSKDPDKVKEVTLPGVRPEHFRYYITVNNSLHGCTLLIPKSAFGECGIFNERLRTTQDYDLWFRMAEKFNFVHIPHLLVKARQHASQGSFKMQDIALLECEQLLMGFVDSLSQDEMIASTNKSISLSYAEISVSMVQRGFYNTARYAARLAMKNIDKGSTANAVKTVSTLLISKLIYTQIGLLRTSFVWSRFIKPLKNMLLSFRIRR
ncbi:MAG: glycosyltransferase [Methanosarcinales archaeon]|nr:MAG: glycosyltransferase [Methanosarcinales archaeon]